MKAALRRIAAIVLVPVVMALSITAAKSARANRSAPLKKIAAAYKYESNAHNNLPRLCNRAGLVRDRSANPFRRVCGGSSLYVTLTTARY